MNKYEYDIRIYDLVFEDTVKSFVRKYFSCDDWSVADYEIDWWDFNPYYVTIWDLCFSFQDIYTALKHDIDRKTLLDYTDDNKGLNLLNYSKLESVNLFNY